MWCLVYVKFLPGGSIAPEEFFSRINAQWSCIEDYELKSELDYATPPFKRPSRKTALCIADYDSIEQFTIDLAIMPGAGISAVEVVPIQEETDFPFMTKKVTTINTR
jgi:hypothetical protein